MGHKIITEEDFWICSSGAMPSPFQGTRTSNKTNDKKVFITVEDTSTISWIDFGCKKYMLLMAIVAALIVVVAVAVGVLTVATGGAGLILLGAIAGVAGGVIGAVVGGMLCGHKMGPARKWLDSKSDFISTGTKTITGSHIMECKAGGVIQYAPNIKSWLGAIGYGTLSYGSELVKCAFAGAAVGTAGSLLGVGSVTAAGTGGKMGAGLSLSRASMQLAWPTFRSVGSNILTSFGIGGGLPTAGIALGSRGIFGAESAATTYATDAVDENGDPVSLADSFAKGALPEYEFGSRIATQGLSGLQWSDALIALYFLNLKTDPKGTFRDDNGNLRNSKNNPRGQRPGSFAKDPRKAKSGGKGKAYEATPVKKPNFEEFVNSVDGGFPSDEIARKAFELFNKGNWKGLENLFNQHGINHGWPPNRGFVSTETTTLEPGFKFDRYGGRTNRNTGKFEDSGGFIADEGTPFGDRGLPADYEHGKPLNSYEVTQKIEGVKKGEAIPWFGQKGGGIQYEIPASEGGIDGLLNSRKIIRQ